MSTLAANELIEAGKAHCRFIGEIMASRPDGLSRSIWYDQHVHLYQGPPTTWVVKDLARASKPRRIARLGDIPYDLRIWTRGGTVVECIDLRSADADERLARYELISRD